MCNHLGQFLRDQEFICVSHLLLKWMHNYSELLHYFKGFAPLQSLLCTSVDIFHAKVWHGANSPSTSIWIMKWMWTPQSRKVSYSSTRLFVCRLSYVFLFSVELVVSDWVCKYRGKNTSYTLVSVAYVMVLNQKKTQATFPSHNTFLWQQDQSDCFNIAFTYVPIFLMTTVTESNNTDAIEVRASPMSDQTNQIDLLVSFTLSAWSCFSDFMFRNRCAPDQAWVEREKLNSGVINHS